MSRSGDRPSKLVLPPVPAHLSGALVAGWRESVSIDTYAPEAPSEYPIYLENRVYQGSSGKVYPLAFHDRISREKKPQSWDAVHLENPWIRLMILPELGGRIHIGYDKTSGYDFFYRNNVIKPALVGLAGPWISGGVEFNWPQHHRPATYLPVDVAIEQHENGSVTVWCSDHDPFHRMKGMHGVTLHPDRAVVQLKVRLHNRTDHVRTFLWWANVAVQVHDDYQSFFPADVHTVADHARRATTSFPRATGRYYGVDYPKRVDAHHPDADRLDWYRNIPVPTSYMCVNSTGDFFGGYDHAAQAGFVHWADHQIAPGKKQWTWGNERFGQAWDRNLSDGDGPYVELMAGVYTDNQPDFAFLTPGETKSFSQYWFPMTGIGTVQEATPEVAVHAQIETSPVSGAQLHLGVAVTRIRLGTVVSVAGLDGRPVWEDVADLSPGRSLQTVIELGKIHLGSALLIVVSHANEQLLTVRVGDVADEPTPVVPATEPPPPSDIGSVEELFLTGLHLTQYRHATRSPIPYWEEALRRDPEDSRTNTACARLRFEAGNYAQAESLLRRAIGRLTLRNGNPYDGEPHYLLGLALWRQGRLDEAYDAWAKAAWNGQWGAAAYRAMARVDCAAKRWTIALQHLDAALTLDADNLAARDLKALVLGRLARPDEAVQLLGSTLTLDPLDWWARDIAGGTLESDARTMLDIAREYASAGFDEESLRVVDQAAQQAGREPHSGQAPLVHYTQGMLLDRLGEPGAASAARMAARQVSTTYCFPHGLEDQEVLRYALGKDANDAVASSLLGHLLYDVGRYAEAIEHWERAVELDPHDAVCWRNLGMARYNVQNDAAAAVSAFERALQAAPDNARLLYEFDQLTKRTGQLPNARLRRLQDRRDLVEARDDLTIEFVGLQVLLGDPEQALELLERGEFHPWEGGEGQALSAWERVHRVLAEHQLAAGDPKRAEGLLKEALDPPESLGEGPHLLANRSDLYLLLGDAYAALNQDDRARNAWLTAATFTGDFQDMSPQPVSEKTVHSALAWRRLGRENLALELLVGLQEHAAVLVKETATIDYFATSLPALLLFKEDLQERNITTATFLYAQAAWGLGRDQESQTLLDDVLSRDPNHSGAQDLATKILTPRPPRHGGVKMNSKRISA